MQRQTESSVCLLVRRTQRISLKRIKKNSLRLQLETFLIMTVKKTWGWAKAISVDHHHTFLGFCLCNSYLSVLVQPLYINLCRKYALHPLQQLQVSLQLAHDSCRICFGTIVKTGLKKYVMRVWWKPLLRFSRMIIFRKNTIQNTSLVCSPSQFAIIENHDQSLYISNITHFFSPKIDLIKNI